MNGLMALAAHYEEFNNCTSPVISQLNNIDDFLKHAECTEIE